MIIKVLSFNIHKGTGWHRFRSTFGAIDQHIRELRPDFIFFQEILGSQAEYIVLDLWSHYSYGRNVVYPKSHFGNAIFSKFPIIYSENFDLTTYRLERRGLLHSIVQLNEQRLHLLCVHLGLFKKSRQKQYEKIIAYIKSTIDDHEPIILGGDFNDWGSHATIPLFQILGLQEAFMTLHHSYARTFPAWAPLLKLDRIYTRGIEVISAKRMLEKSWRMLSDHIAITVDFNF
jgi:endonuclease/exonuclease/phosphatase family metal-dependent hydrolase